MWGGRCSFIVIGPLIPLRRFDFISFISPVSFVSFVRFVNFVGFVRLVGFVEFDGFVWVPY